VLQTGIESINQDVLAYFSNFRNGMDILKLVRPLPFPFVSDS
jgi:hypothetical protein